MNKFGKEYHNEYYMKRKAAIFEYLGGVCVECGTTEGLEMDHINRADKSFEVSSRLSLKNNREEFDKCQLLCKEHHRAKTSLEQSGWTHGTTYGWLKKKCECEICLVEKAVCYKRKNAKRRADNSAPRGPYNLPAEHGTIKRYKRGCHCDECRAINAAIMRDTRAGIVND